MEGASMHTQGQAGVLILKGSSFAVPSHLSKSTVRGRGGREHFRVMGNEGEIHRRMGWGAGGGGELPTLHRPL